MALTSFDTIGENKTVLPSTEQGRLNQIAADRALFNGDFTELHLEVDPQDIPPVKINWMKRASTFYPEFMLADRPEIVVEKNERLTELLGEIAGDWYVALQQANVNMLSLGEGVIVSDPVDPTRLLSWPPDWHYVVEDTRGIILGDILIRVRGDVMDNAEIDVIQYPVAGEPTWRQYKYRPGYIESFVRTQEIPNRTGRQVVTINLNAEGTGVIREMSSPVGGMSRMLTALSKTIERNSRPHLYGPDGAVTLDENGNAVINTEGMYLPMQQGDHAPGYLTWDNQGLATQWDYEVLENGALAMAGLTPMLFNPSTPSGEMSGTALKRLMMPFVARLNHLARLNETAIEELVVLWNANRGSVGEEVFSFDVRDIRVEWSYDDLFEDTNSTETMGGGENANQREDTGQDTRDSTGPMP